MDILTPSGEVLTVDAAHHADLFYAHRGGCSSAFGPVSTFTLQLTPFDLPGGNLTVVSFPHLPGEDRMLALLLWWQTWATREAPPELSLTVVCFIKEGQLSAYLKGVYIGSLVQAEHTILPALLDGLAALYGGEDVVRRSLWSASLLDTVLWMHQTGYHSLDQLLTTFHLPVDRRNRYKSSSIIVLQEAPANALREVIRTVERNQANHIEFKAYGGAMPIVGRPVHDDPRGPLRRGHLYEFHLEMGYREVRGEWGRVHSLGAAQGKLQLVQGIALGWHGAARLD